MVYTIQHKEDNSAYCKQERGLSELCKSKNGAAVYYRQNSAGRYDYYFAFLGLPSILRAIEIDSYYTPERAAEQMTERNTPTAADELNRIKQAITDGRWTSNADALFCELMNDSETAAAVRVNRARIYEQREREEQQYAREQQERKEREEQQRRENTDKAEAAYKRGEFITAEGFELLADKYGVKLPARLVAWLRECCGGLRVYRDYHEYCGAWLAVQYKAIKGRKSTTIGDYGAKVAQAMGITAA